MRFEVYVCHGLEDNDTMRIVLLTDNWKDVCYHITCMGLSPNEQHIVLDNQTPSPLNYKKLGFINPPCETDCYPLVYSCKTAKHKTLSLLQENFVPFYNCAIELALYETLVFFQKK